MSFDTEPQAPFLGAIEDAAELAHRMRSYGIQPEQVAAIFASVALDCGGRAFPTEPAERVRDWLFSLLGVDSIEASQASALTDATAAQERRGGFRVIEGGAA